MSGQIFISYRREDSSAWAGRLSDRLSSHFPSNQIFMDVDTIEPGIDFVEAIEESVVSCDVLIAVIGTRWLNSTNSAGKRRLEILEDSVRVEISTALKRGIRVIPVLVEGATMPEAADLPDELKALVRRNALKLSHDRFRTESELLASTVGRVLEQAGAKRPEQEEAEPPDCERRKTEEKEGLEAEQRQKEEETAPPIFGGSPSQEDASSPPVKRPNKYKTKTRWLLAVAATITLFTVITAIKVWWDIAQAKVKSDTEISDYTESIRLHPNFADAYLYRGITYYYSGEVDKAISDYTSVIRLNPSDARAYCYRGEAYYAEKKDYTKAISDFTEAIRLKPNYAEAYDGRGETYRRQGKFDEANADFKKGQELEIVGH